MGAEEVTAAEISAELGTNWVLARRTKNIVAKYGETVNCLSHKAYDDAIARIVAKRNYAGIQFTAEEWVEIGTYATALKANEPKFTLTGYRTLAEMGREEHQSDCRTIASWTDQLGRGPFDKDKYRNGMNGEGPGIVIRIAKRCAARRAAFEQAGLSVYQWPSEDERNKWNQIPAESESEMEYERRQRG